MHYKDILYRAAVYIFIVLDTTLHQNHLKKMGVIDGAEYVSTFS